MNPYTPTETVKWTCAACGMVRATILMPEETRDAVIDRLIRDHIFIGCPAYSQPSENPSNRNGGK